LQIVEVRRVDRFSFGPEGILFFPLTFCINQPKEQGYTFAVN